MVLVLEEGYNPFALVVGLNCIPLSKEVFKLVPGQMMRVASLEANLQRACLLWEEEVFSMMEF